MKSYWTIQFNWNFFVCSKTGEITSSLAKRRRKSLAQTTNSEDERLQKDIEQLNFIQNYQNEHLEEENRYFVGYGTKWIIRKVMNERRKSRWRIEINCMMQFASPLLTQWNWIHTNFENWSIILKNKIMIDNQRSSCLLVVFYTDSIVWSPYLTVRIISSRKKHFLSKSSRIFIFSSNDQEIFRTK